MVTLEHAAEIDAAIGDARLGRPGLLVIEGTQGSGKTTVLREALDRADGFEVMATEGSENDYDAYSTLSRLGFALPPAASPLVAAQVIRERFDSSRPGRPSMLAIDDIQWADPDSVDAVGQLLARSQHGDAMLVIVASHANASGPRERLEDDARAGATRRVSLEGLSLAEARELASRSRPNVGSEVVERVWAQTGGNPLYFSSILDEFEPSEVDSMGFLPAPEAFARSIARHLDRLGASATALMQASAVLGSEWESIATVATLAGVSDALPAVQALLKANLLAYRPSTALLGEIRPVHALIRAAVYQRIDLELRSRLHLAAATFQADANARLAHRVSAATGLDDGLAQELANAAVRNHEIAAFRRAADQLMWASRLSSDPDARRERLLDGWYERVLVEERLDVGALLTSIDDRGDGRPALIAAASAVQSNRWTEAMRLLEAVIERPDASMDPLVRYRCEVLAAWAGNGYGMPTAWLRERFARARAAGATDPIMHGYVVLTELQLAGRDHDMEGYRGFTASLTARATDVPIAESYELMSRGIARTVAGDHAAALEDLAEMERRFHLGFMDLGDGVTHGFLGLAHWLRGEWQLAEVKFRAGREMLRSSANPVSSSLSAIGLISSGNFEEADSLLVDVHDRLAHEPWREAIRIYTIALGVRLHVGGDPTARATALQMIEDDFGDVARDNGAPAYPVWLVPRCWLSIWAGRITEARALARRLRDMPNELPWVRAASFWLDGLISEQEGEPGRARRQLDDALSGGIADIPMFHAHCLADRARISGNQQDLRRAIDLYRALGQNQYLARMQDLDGALQTTSAATVLDPLSERERDVFALVAQGLSYAQIAHSLFISKSTVAFHLSNIYAKTGVNSRHELAALADGER